MELPPLSPRFQRRAKGLCKGHLLKSAGDRPWPALTAPPVSLGALLSVHIWSSSCQALVQRGRETPPWGVRGAGQGAQAAARSLLHWSPREPRPSAGRGCAALPSGNPLGRTFHALDSGMKHRRACCPQTSETPGDLKKKVESAFELHLQAEAIQN